jgi:hypothetical protein
MGNSKMAEGMEEVSKFSQMETTMRENGKMIKNMAVVFTHTQIKQSLRVSSMKENVLAKESTLLLIAMCSRLHLKMDK